MINMKKIFRDVSVFAILLGGLAACGDKDAGKSFLIEAAKETYEFDIDDHIKLDIKDVVKIKDTSALEFVFMQDTAKASISKVENDFVYMASSEGMSKIYGKIGNVVSSNIVTIQSVPSANYKSPTDVAKNIEKAFDTSGGLVFGEIYDVGISKKDVDKYRIEGADGLIKFNEEGKIEVIGFGYPDGNQKIKVFYENNVIFTDFLNIFASILCKEIRLSLYEQGMINSVQATVKHELLTHVTSLSLDGKIINDESSRLGIKYLTNLSYLDLSNNNLSDLSFVGSLRNLKTVHLANNYISDIDSIVDNQDLEVLDLSNNNIKDLRKVQHLHNIKELDVSNNEVTDISPVSSVYSLESLNLNHNTLNVYKEPLSNLDSLRKLSIGYCGISFNEIKSLSYLNELVELDISDTGANLDTISRLTKLKRLVLEKCDLSTQDIAKLNSLTNLEELMLGYNSLDMSNFQNKLDGSLLTKIKTLGIGGNDFSDIPNLASFTHLKNLDLSNSYNLLSIEGLNGMDIEYLNLDASNSISDFSMTIIDSLTNLKKLSMREAFNYITKDIYDSLALKVNGGDFELRLLGDRFVDSNTIYNYRRSVFFSLSEFLDNYEIVDGHHKVKAIKSSDSYNREIIVSVVNDPVGSRSAYLDIDSSLFRLDFYGNEYATYHYIFNIENRKQSKFTLGLSDMKIVGENHSFDVENPTVLRTEDNKNGSVTHEGKTHFVAPAETIIKASAGSKLEILSISGNNSLQGGNGLTRRLQDDLSSGGRDHKISEAGRAIDCYDLILSSNGGESRLEIKGGNGGDGKNCRTEFNDSDLGIIGGHGAEAIYCNNLNTNNGTFNINGGNGGNGGNSRYIRFLGDPWDGQDAGDGANAISYGNILSIRSNSGTLQGGKGGKGGKGEGNATVGKNGKDGLPYAKH